MENKNFKCKCPYLNFTEDELLSEELEVKKLKDDKMLLIGGDKEKYEEIVYNVPPEIISQLQIALNKAKKVKIKVICEPFCEEQYVKGKREKIAIMEYCQFKTITAMEEF